MISLPSTALAALLALSLSHIPAAAAGWFEGKRYPIATDADFPADEYILDQARFWFEIYYVVAEDEGLLHDPFHPHLVLRKVKVPAEPGRASSKVIDAVLDRLRGEMKAAAAKEPSARTPEEAALMAMLPSHWDTTHVQLCAERLRFQRGLKNKFRAGVERSYRYLPLIDSVFAAKGLPARLKYLPHVESSFYPHAYSKVGAAGMWQFMKSSARLFKMKVGYHVDERRDPIASTSAAAAMLAYNRNYLKTWPLALVAYNHGPGGLAKAARITGTRDLTTIIKSYYSNSFGFASKNFYAEFLAASSIALKADSLYPGLAKMEPLRFQQIVLPRPVGTRLLGSLTGLSAAELEEYNLGLRPATFRANAQLPKGHKINLPVGLDLPSLALRLGAGGQALAAVQSAKPAPPAKSASAAPAIAAAPTAGSVTPAEVLAAPAPAPKAAVQVAAPADPAARPASAAEVALAAPAPEAAPVDKSLSRDAAPAAPSAPSAASPRNIPATAAAGQAAPKAASRLAAALKPKAGDKPASPRDPAAKPLASGELRAAGPAPAEALPPGKAPEGKPGVPMPVALATPPSVQGSAPLSAALPKPPKPAAPALAAQAPARPARPEPAVVDSTFALQVAGADKLAHPMDRFNPAIYNLGHEYAKGMLTIKVGTEETLSHYAEWAWIPERTLRGLNRIRTARDLRLGRAIRIPMAEEKAKDFLAKREEYYRAMEEDFYGSYHVSSVEPLVVAKGMNLWGLINEKEIPYWLLQKHNPKRSLGAIIPGDTLSIPTIETGIRKWGFTRYGNSREYLAGITRVILADR